jgi:hypothetical protein
VEAQAGAAGRETPAARTGTVVEGDAPAQNVRPSLTVPQILAVAAFLVFAWFAADPSDSKATLNGVEYDKLKSLTLFLIGALLPSDALIRFGRSILFTKVKDPDDAKYAPSTTTAQLLAFAVYTAVVVAMLAGNNVVTATEGTQIVDVAQALIIALLPSDAAIRFGRALNLRAKPTAITRGELKRV